MEWLSEVLEGMPDGLHWSQRRRMAILARWPERRQLEAHVDALIGRPETAAAMAADIAAIKLAIPKTDV